LVEVYSVFFLIHVLFGLLSHVFVLDLLFELLEILLFLVVGYVVAIIQHLSYQPIREFLRVNFVLLSFALFMYSDLLVENLFHPKVRILLLIIFLVGLSHLLFPFTLGLDFDVVEFKHFLFSVLPLHDLKIFLLNDTV